ncbi:MAG TPA: metallophosphoesterase [Candidatus Polarisedimenticolaceae bacterium]|nr:metallophosphoesterase [Candidatus Polarisedimenticolaceae bacterium]
MRWLVGDVHGCARELDRLLREVRFDPSRDELWSVGDLVNTGPDSLAALRLWRELGGRGVLGNHDIYALRVAAGMRARRPDTLDELLGADDHQLLLDALRALPVLVRLSGDERGPPVWLVHAGLHPGWSDLAAVARRINRLPHDDGWTTSPWVSFAVHVRCCTADGEMSEDPGPPTACAEPFRPWDSFYTGDSLVVHGHWALRGHYRGPRTMSLDSGCVYGGGLTAWCQEEDRLVRVPSYGRKR